jgi:hypothetical protein
LAAGALQAIGKIVDARIGELVPRPSGNAWRSSWPGLRLRVCQESSLVLALGLAVYGFAKHGLIAIEPTSGLAGLLVLSLLAIHGVCGDHQFMRLPLLAALNWQVLLVIAVLSSPGQPLFTMEAAEFSTMSLLLAAVAAGSLFLWQGRDRVLGYWRNLLPIHLWTLRVFVILSICASLSLPVLTAAHVALAIAAFVLVIAAELMSACRDQREERVWTAEAAAAAAVAYLIYFQLISFGHGRSMFILLGVGFFLWLIGEWARGRATLNVLTRPLQWTALGMPLVVAGIGIYRHLFLQPVWLGANSLALLLAAGFYFWRGLERSSKPFIIVSAIILNIALAFLWRELAWHDPQFFMIPIGISILAFVQLLREEIPAKLHNPLRYLGALVILVSPTFHIVGGSWLHLFSLMLASVAIILTAMGLRVRALMYTGAAFLVADLVAMVVRGSIDDPNVLWIAGLTLGAAVIALAAVCERNREELLDRMRLLSETLKNWE